MLPAATVLALVTLVAPSLVAADGGPGAQPEVLEPLVFKGGAFLAADGTVVDAPVLEAALPVPAPKDGVADPVAWSWTAPIRSTQRSPFVLTLQVRAEETTLVRDPLTGKSFAAAVARNGELFEDSVRERAPEGSIMEAGTVATLEFGLGTGGATFEEGDRVEILVWSYVPQLRPSLSYLVGGATPSTLAYRLQAESPADLGIETGGRRLFLLEGFFLETVKNATVSNLTILHDQVLWSPAATPAGARALVAIRSSETAHDASAHVTADRVARKASLHAFLVDGERIETYPGTALLIELKPTANVTITCAQQCPESGFAAVLPVSGGTQNSESISSSSEEPEGGRPAPIPPPVALAAVLAVAAFAARRGR